MNVNTTGRCFQEIYFCTRPSGLVTTLRGHAGRQCAKVVTFASTGTRTSEARKARLGTSARGSCVDLQVR